MRGDKKIIEHLNKILKNELTAINQYFLHSRMLRDWGLHTLADKEHEESIDEMRHAQDLMDRILFLEGLPNLQSLDRLRVGETVAEILRADLSLEMDALPDLKAAIEYAEKVEDYVTRTLLTDILSSEEDHVDWLETQVGLLERLGEQNYQQSMVGAGKTEG